MSKKTKINADAIVNPFRGWRIDCSLLRSYPVTCLNGEDMNRPKTAIIGGVGRPRISSQSLKRVMRMRFREALKHDGIGRTQKGD